MMLQRIHPANIPNTLAMTPVAYGFYVRHIDMTDIGYLDWHQYVQNILRAQFYAPSLSPFLLHCSLHFLFFHESAQNPPGP